MYLLKTVNIHNKNVSICHFKNITSSFYETLNRYLTKARNVIIFMTSHCNISLNHAMIAACFFSMMGHNVLKHFFNN